MIKLILVSSKLVMCHANDLVDQSILENDKLSPNFMFGSVYEAILEIVDIVRLNIGKKPLTLQYKMQDF